MSGIWLYNRRHNMVASVSILVLPCAASPDHAVADEIVENGCDEPLAFCRSCAGWWKAETARMARLRRLLPAHRAWLAERGVDDWGTP